MKKLLILVTIFNLFVLMVQSACVFGQDEGNLRNNNSITFKRTGNPDLDLKNYAKANNISEKEAKIILQEMFGDPQIPDGECFDKIAVTGNPDMDLKNYAIANNISEKEAKIILQEMFGDPQIPDDVE